MMEWIKENGLISDVRFGFMTGKFSVEQLCRLMNDLESKKGKALFLFSVDCKREYDRKGNVAVYKRLKDNGLPSAHTSSTFCLAELSKSLARLESHLPGYLYASECPQGLPLPPLKELNSKSKGTYPYADHNTICLQTRPNESRPEFIQRTGSVVNSVEATHRKIKGVLAKGRSVLTPFFQHFQGTEI